ncbi:MAG: hypothetical protein ACI9SG_002999 [Maribacter sp.]|jgi:hypothetical protein
MDRIEDNSCFKLYALGLFFIEKELELNTDKVLDISIFVSGNKLNKYAGEVILEY